MQHYHSSALPRIMTCPGSVALVEQAPTRDKTDSSEDGTAFHHFAAHALTHAGAHAPSYVGEKAPNGIVCDAEMNDHAHAYAVLLRAQPDWLQRVEYPMHWGPGGAANDGQSWQVRVRCDSVTWRPDILTLAVVDAKYGHRYVDPANNWQLLSQAIGACFAMNIAPERVILAVYQPRGPGEAFRHVEISGEELHQAYRRLCSQLNSLTDTLVTSSHCLYCAGQPGCPAFERAAFAAVDVVMTGRNFDVTPATMRARLDMLDRAEELVKQYKQAIEGAALAELRAGKIVPGLSTKQTLGNTTWREGVTATQLRLLGNDFIEEHPVTPAEAVRRGLSAENYKELTHRPPRGVKIVRGDGVKEAAKAFATPAGEKPKPKRAKKQ